MKKEFAVPPVIFPATTTSTAATTTTNVQHRKISMPPFQQSRASTSNVPFMSFEIGAASSASSTGPISGGFMPSVPATFEEEEPLLDELGIHPDQIWRKIRSILNPIRSNASLHKDSDLSGPILLYLTLCLFQLLVGKLQFGVLLGWIVISSIFLYIVFNMLAGRNGNLDLHKCTSVIGYCLLPIVILSAVLLFVPPQGGLRLLISVVPVIWASRTCTNLMVSLADGGEEHRGLIAYACFLIYTLFSLLVIF